MDNIGIVNLALSHLGAAPVQSLDEGSAEANAAKLNYDAARRSALRANPWSFALRTATLAKLEAAAPDFAHVYALPQTCVKALRLIAPHKTEPGGEPFVIRGGTLCTDSVGASLEYVADITDPAEFDDLFVEVFSYHLASKLAMPVTGNGGNAQNFLQIARQLTVEAAANSARDRRDAATTNAYLDARR